MKINTPLSYSNVIMAYLFIFTKSNFIVYQSQLPWQQLDFVVLATQTE